MDGSLARTAAALAGILSHAVYFNKGEHHLHGLKYLQALTLVIAVVTAILVRALHHTVQQAFLSTASLAAIYVSALLTATIIWRAFFNPLNRFPGPFIPRLTGFWFSYINTGGQCYKCLLALHQIYGDFVRVGPNEVSITHPDVVQALYGHGSGCRKGSWYDQDKPLVSLHTARDRGFHDRRRRVWNPAFNGEAMKGYEGRVRPYTDLLAGKIAENGEVDVTAWFNWFSFDVGKSSHAVVSSKSSPVAWLISNQQ